MSDTQTSEETLPKPIRLSEDDLELKERAWSAFGRRKKMPFASLAQTLTRAALVRRLISLEVLEVDESDHSTVRKTDRPIGPREQLFHRGSEFGDAVQRPDLNKDTRDSITEKVRSLSQQEHDILVACIVSVDWGSTSHVFRVKLTEARSLADCSSEDIATIMKKIGLVPSGNKGCTWVLPIWIRSII